MKSQISVAMMAITVLLLFRCVVAQENDNLDGNAFEPGKVLAIVGGEPIFVGDMLFEANQFLARNASGAPESMKNELRSQVIERMLPSFIEQRILLIAVKADLPAEVDFEEVVANASKEFDKQALEKLMEQAGVDSPAEFDAHLRAQGSSLRKLRYSWTETQFVRAMMMEKIQTDVDVSHRELLDYYHQHFDDYKIKARAKWEQIMVRFDRFESKEDARQAIVELGDKVVFGASLSGIAKKHSHGYRAHEGGQHDWTRRGSLVLKEIDKAIFTLPIGKLSDIIESDRGFHIVRVIDRQEDSVTSFLDAQVEIRKQIEAERRMAAYHDHIAKLKEKIPVEIITDAPVRSAAKSASGDDATPDISRTR